jgi:hypothetical protein
VLSVPAAKGAKLAEFKLGGRILLVFLSRIVPALAINACQ